MGVPLGNERIREGEMKWINGREGWKEQRRLMIESLRTNPCMDCHNSFPPECMDFDHRDPDDKFKDISDLLYATGLNILLEEIKKCDLVCANCHRIRTKKRMEEKREIGIYKRDLALAEEHRISMLNMINQIEIKRLEILAQRAHERVKVFNSAMNIKPQIL